jgi:hypothetical protein
MQPTFARHGSRENMELTLPTCFSANREKDATSDRTATEVAPPTDHLGIRTAMFWLTIGSAMVATAIVTMGWKRTLQVWSFSGVALALVFVAERLWYKFVLKSE